MEERRGVFVHRLSNGLLEVRSAQRSHGLYPTRRTARSAVRRLRRR